MCSCFLCFKKSDQNWNSLSHELHLNITVSLFCLDWQWLNKQYSSPKSQDPVANCQQMDTFSVRTFCLCVIRSLSVENSYLYDNERVYRHYTVQLLQTDSWILTRHCKTHLFYICWHLFIELAIIWWCICFAWENCENYISSMILTI